MSLFMLGCVLFLLIHPADGKITTKEQTSPPVRIDRDGIYLLNERNFNSFLSASISKEQRQGLFVKFYAPWCGHCKELEQPWMGIATAVELYQSSLDELEIKSINKVSVASFDCATGPQATKFCKEDLSITGFPTIMYFEGNEYKKVYVGTRGFEDLSIFVERESGLSFPYLNGFRRWKATSFFISSTSPTVAFHHFAPSSASAQSYQASRELYILSDQSRTIALRRTNVNFYHCNHERASS